MAAVTAIDPKEGTGEVQPDAVPLPVSYFDGNPLDAARVAIANEVARILDGIDRDLVFNCLDRGNAPAAGDLLLAAPRLSINGIAPAKLAEKIVAEFNTSSTSTTVKSPVADGVMVRFFLAPEHLAQAVIPLILNLGDSYGFNDTVGLRDPGDASVGPKRVVVEFSSPNIAKKFHCGHLRSTIIGGFLANLYERAGYDVVRMNYLGDWGRQYGLLACGWSRYGDASAFEQDPIGHLFDVYVRINRDFAPEEEAYKAARDAGLDTSRLEGEGLLGEAKAYFKRMEDGDEDALRLWRQFRDLSIERYRETYARLNIEFTDYSGESCVRKDLMEKAEALLRHKGIAEEDQGAVVIDFEKQGAKLNKVILRNRNGTTNYLLRDVGAAIQRWDQHKFDEMLYVVMCEQEAHVRSLFKTLELMGGEYALMAGRMRHINFGKVHGMSTRRGTVKFLDDLITDVSSFMHDVMKRNEAKYKQVADPAHTAEQLAISAIMVQDMTGKRINGYHYDLDRMTSFEGDTGPYLQYAHARLCSIFRRLDEDYGDGGLVTTEEMLGADLGRLLEGSGHGHAVALLRQVARFPDVVAHAMRTLEPTTVLTYLFKMAHELSSSYDHLRVVGCPEGRAVGVARAALYAAARQVLGNGMRLLGITPVERM